MAWVAVCSDAVPEETGGVGRTCPSQTDYSLIPVNGNPHAMSTSDNPFEPPISSIGANQKMSRLKKFALAVLASMIGTGLVLALIMAVAIIPELIGSREGPSNLSEEVENPPGLRIVQHARVADTDQFTVQGVVQNLSATEWTVTSIEVVVSVAGKKVNKCEGMLYENMRPGSRRAFQIECGETTGIDLPEGTRYEVSIVSARKRNKPQQGKLQQGKPK